MLRLLALTALLLPAAVLGKSSGAPGCAPAKPNHPGDFQPDNTNPYHLQIMSVSEGVSQYSLRLSQAEAGAQFRGILIVPNVELEWVQLDDDHYQVKDACNRDIGGVSTPFPAQVTHTQGKVDKDAAVDFHFNIADASVTSISSVTFDVIIVKKYATYWKSFVEV